MSGTNDVILRGTRILVVDDENDMIDLVSFILEERGAAVQSANCVPDALQVVEDFRPEAMVSDIGMPHEDGFSLIRKIRARGDELAGMPAVALTAFSRPDDVRRVMEAGYDVYLAKPADAQSLLRAVHRAMGKSVRA